MLEWKRDGWKAAIYLAPASIILLVFVIYPLFSTFIISFFQGFDINYTFDSIGIDNYKIVLSDSLFWKSVGNTFIMVFVSVPISITVSLLIAVFLNSIKQFQGVFQTIFFLPYVTNVIAIGMVFSALFNKDFGLVNAVLQRFGMDIVNWKAGGATYLSALTVLTAYTVWSSLAFKIMVFLSGLQSIDKQYYQAAQIDGTPKWRVLWRITVPLLSPMIAYITIVSFIGAFKAYASIIAVFGGNAGPPGNPRMLTTMVWYIYKEGLERGMFGRAPGGPGYMGVASAAAVLLFIMILIFTMIQMYISKKRVHY